MKESKQIKKAKQKPEPEVPVPAKTPRHIIELHCAPPDFMMQEALEEPDREFLQSYAEVIRVLRDEKHFSYREIAEWLNERGMEVDHNSIYRVYMSNLDEGGQAHAAMRDAEEEANRR